jgi:hypothetical protein
MTTEGKGVEAIARERLGIDLKGCIRVVARDAERYCDTRSQGVLLNVIRMG